VGSSPIVSTSSRDRRRRDRRVGARTADPPSRGGPDGRGRPPPRPPPATCRSRAIAL